MKTKGAEQFKLVLQEAPHTYWSVNFVKEGFTQEEVRAWRWVGGSALAKLADLYRAFVNHRDVVARDWAMHIFLWMVEECDYDLNLYIAPTWKGDRIMDYCIQKMMPVAWIKPLALRHAQSKHGYEVLLHTIFCAHREDGSDGGAYTERAQVLLDGCEALTLPPQTFECRLGFDKPCNQARINALIDKRRNAWMTTIIFLTLPKRWALAKECLPRDVLLIVARLIWNDRWKE